MFRVMYISTALIDFTDSELEKLLENARKNNTVNGITGLLVIKGRTFLQCLEGEKNEIIKTFEKIKNDKRHTSIIKIVEEEASERYFPDWSMGYKNIRNFTNIESKKLKDFSNRLNSEYFSESDIPQVFKEFVETN